MQRSARKLRYGILTADTIVVVVALVAASGLREGFAQLPLKLLDGVTYAPILACSICAWAVVYVRMRLDGFHRGWNWSKVCSEIAVGVAIVTVLVAATAFLTRDYLPRLLLLYFSVLLLIGFVTVRAVARMSVRTCWRKPSRRVVIVGSGKVARELANKFESHPEMLCEVVGFLCPNGGENETATSGSNPQAESVAPNDVTRLLVEKNATDIVVAFSGQAVPAGLLDLVGRCRAEGIRVSVVPHVYELYTSRASMSDIDGVPVLSLDDTSPNRAAQITKRAFDLLAATTLLPLAALVLLPAALYLRALRGQVLSRDVRCGKNGRSFVLYRLDVERCGAGLTRFERMLDRTSITELPQLWNVLCGEMSVVGPRPEAPERVLHYSDWQKQRLALAPGITGLAQVHGLRDQSSSEEKAHFDLQYIASRSISSDVILVLQTLWTLALRTRPSPRSTTPNSYGPGLAGITGFSDVDSAHSSAD